MHHVAINSLSSRSPSFTGNLFRNLLPTLLLTLPLLLPATAAPAPAPVQSLIELHRIDQESLERAYPLWFSENRIQRLEAFLQTSRQSLEKVAFEELDQDGKVDYLLFKNHLRFQEQELKRTRRQLRETDSLLPFHTPLIQLLESRQQMEPAQGRKAADTLNQAKRDTQAVIAKLDPSRKDNPDSLPSPSPVLAHRSLRVLNALRDQLQSWNQFYAGYDPVTSWWIRTPFADLDSSLQKLASELRRIEGYRTDQDEAPLVGDPIGREALEQSLKAEWIPYSPEELLEIAEKEFAWCDAEWKRAANDLGLGDDWRKALDHVANLHRQPGEQPELIRNLAQEAIGFLEQRKLVTIPPLCKEVWRMEMMSPERQKVNPYFTGGEVISVSFPTDTMAHEDKIMSLRGNNIHFCRATVHHELIPGHHLQLFMADRYKPYRKIFNTPFLVEGWALHWEMLLWDLQFAPAAEDRVGMLFWRTHRCARILFSLRFHLGKMSADEAVQFLVTRVGHEPRNARAEVRRSIEGNYSPLYQAAYMLGGLQLRALHRDLVGSSTLTQQQFHDGVLRENAIPIELIRASLTRQPLKPDMESSWKFYNIALTGPK